MKKQTRETRRIDMLVRVALGEDPILDADRKTQRIDAAHTILGSLIADRLLLNVGGGRLWPSTAGFELIETAALDLERKLETLRRAISESGLGERPKACEHRRLASDPSDIRGPIIGVLRRAIETMRCLDCGEKVTG